MKPRKPSRPTVDRVRAQVKTRRLLYLLLLRNGRKPDEARREIAMTLVGVRS